MGRRGIKSKSVQREEERRDGTPMRSIDKDKGALWGKRIAT